MHAQHAAPAGVAGVRRCRRGRSRPDRRARSPRPACRRSAIICSASLRPSRPLMPALLTRMSRRGVSLLTSSNIAATAAAVRDVRRHPCPPSRSAVARAAARLRSLMMRRAPSSAKRRAMAAPSPRAAPVIRATLSFNLSMPASLPSLASAAASDAAVDHDVQQLGPGSRRRAAAPPDRIGLGDVLGRHAERLGQRREVDAGSAKSMPM